MSDQLNTSPEMCIYWHDQTIKANHKVAELEARVAELEHTLTAACNREGDCIARHIEGGVCCAWIGRDATPPEDQQ